jgi:hypothetical protein
MIGRRHPAGPDFAALAGEIDELEDAIRRTAAAPRPLAQRLAEVERDWHSCQAQFERYGASAIGVTPAERNHFAYRALRGCLYLLASDRILETERQRVSQAGDGVDETERAERLAQLRRQLRTLHARREVAWRALEAAGETVERGSMVDPEMYIAPDDELVAIADGREIAA